MNTFNTVVKSARLATAISGVMVIASASVAGDFDNTWYLGAGAGKSKFDIDTASGISIKDDKDVGYKVFGGYDINRQFSVEAFYTDLGTTKFNPAGEADFSAYGASALWYFWRNAGDYDMRHGWQAYLHAGVSSLDANASSNLGFKPDDGSQFHYGAALEYGWNNGIAIRAGLDGYESDAAVASISLLKRFGKSHAKTEPKAAEPAPVEAAVVAPVVVKPKDSDNDGVIDTADKCPGTAAGTPVNADGCEITKVVLEGVNFELNSAELTNASYARLDKAAATLKKYSDIRVEVQAYTDSMGETAYNQYLSEKRAESVRGYLIKQGIDGGRLEAKGYGESSPVADNGTREGRASNRRVELKIIE